LGNIRVPDQEGRATPGTIEQRSETSWRVRVYAGRENGKVRWVSRTVTGTRRTAQKELAKLATEVESQQVVAGHPISLGELLDRWLGDIAPHRSAYTMAEYRRLVNRDIAPVLGNVRLDKLSAQQLDKYYRALCEGGLSNASVRRRHFLLHAALGRGVKWGLLASNPSDRATPPPLTRSTVSAPAVGEVQRLIVAAEQDGDAVLAVAIALGAVTGARLGELCALRWSDVSWSRRTLHVARSLTVIGGKVSEGPTKAHAARFVALGTALEALLRKRMDDQAAFAKLVGVELVADAYVLSRGADGSVACLPHGLTNAFTRVTRRAGISTHFHALRHFSATTAIAAGMDVRTVAGRLGHAGPSVTLRVYAHALEQRDRELAGLLGNAVLGPVNAGTKLDEADPPATKQRT
jgi:integrase